MTDRATRPFKGLINAVLRGLTREPPPEPDPEALAPGWLFARWRAAYGEPAARAMASVICEEPATDVTPRDPADAGLAAELQAEALPGGSLRVGHRGDITAWPGAAPELIGRPALVYYAGIVRVTDGYVTSARVISDRLAVERRIAATRS